MSAHLSDEILQQLADGLLQGAPLAAAEVHLLECGACAALCDEYASLFEGLESMPVPPPPARFTAQVMARVEARERDLAHERRVAFATLAGSAVIATGCFAAAGDSALAHQLSSWLQTAL